MFISNQDMQRTVLSDRTDCYINENGRLIEIDIRRPPNNLCELIDYFLKI